MKLVTALLVLSVFTIAYAVPVRQQQEDKDYPVFLQDLVRSMSAKQLMAELQQEDEEPVFAQQEEEEEEPVNVKELVRLLAKAQQEDEEPVFAQQGDDDDEGPVSAEALVRLLAKAQQEEDENGQRVFKMQDNDKAVLQRWWHHIVRHALHHIVNHFFGKK